MSSRAGDPSGGAVGLSAFPQTAAWAASRALYCACQARSEFLKVVGGDGSGCCTDSDSGPGLLCAVMNTPWSEKKADVVDHPEVFDHVGLLGIGPPSTAGLPFI